MLIYSVYIFEVGYPNTKHHRPFVANPHCLNWRPPIKWENPGGTEPPVRHEDETLFIHKKGKMDRYITLQVQSDSVKPGPGSVLPS